MKIEQFIENNREELKAIVKKAVPNNQYDDDGELEDWILNDEGLYNWALPEGVEDI